MAKRQKLYTGTGTNPSRILFRGAGTVDEKLDRLAECFADAKTWRGEEADRMDALETRIKVLEGQRK
jgi:hypothetical protein